MSKVQEFCKICKNNVELKSSKTRIHERMLALSLDEETKKSLHHDYINMIKEELEEKKKEIKSDKNTKSDLSMGSRKEK